eukprot:TRINITY_DN1327_c2_g1_i14.p1 TRINITY_DN1327_c2_g1~~TRINITY_DN1327_c2_g1_i14.p1  ORF type:complete len:382 (+),score=128.55 TRINITY_DN1327_c2_g1_i14:108-1148(+)
MAAVELPVDATFGMLKRAAREAGGPEESKQLLSIGGEELRCSDKTPLSEVDQMASEVTITVRHKLHPAAAPSAVCVGRRHAAVLLESGGLLEWGEAVAESPPTGEGATAVCAGWGFTAAVVDGALTVWGELGHVDRIRSDLQQLTGGAVSHCSAYHRSLAVVTPEGHLFLCGDIKGKTSVPEELQGRVAAVAVGFCFVVVVIEDGTAHHFGESMLPSEVDLGGRAVVAASAGWTHYALVLEDGSVVCGGGNDKGQCDVPADLRDAVSCSCGYHFTVALRRDGTLSWWGRVPPNGCIAEAGCIAAVAAYGSAAAAVTADGRLVADGKEARRACGVLDPPQVAVRRLG